MILKYLIVCCALTACSLMPNAQTLRLMSYNIHHARNESGVVDVEGLARFILAQQADVIALQEVDSVCNRSGRTDIMRELGRLTGMYYYFGKAMDYDGGGYGEGLLSRFPVTAVRTLALPTDPGLKSEPRSAIEAVIEAPGRQPFMFIATHLDHLRTDTDRMLQTAFLANRYWSEAMPFVLAGDMNDTPDSRSMQQLFAVAGMPDADKALPTWPSKEPRVKIDYILFSKNHPWRVLHFRVPPEEHVSDHRPVVADVTW